MHNDSLTEKTKLLPHRFVYVKNVNKLVYTEEEIVTFICPARQFIFLNLNFATVYNFSFSSVGGKGLRGQIDFVFFPEYKFLAHFKIDKCVSDLQLSGLLYVVAALIYFKKPKINKSVV